jgi:DNA processing protein
MTSHRVVPPHHLPGDLADVMPPLGPLFLRGADPVEPAVAVIGSRRATGYGLSVARDIGRFLGAWGVNVVSGLAAGIDGAAHRGALDAGGFTTAVLGSGIDVWYPARNRDLGEEIVAAGGAVLSEYPSGTPPAPWQFPARNRIIAAMVGAVIVVEAADRSGALITARMALDLGRDVYAVPGDIDRETSLGCNRLIRDGAHPIDTVEVLGELLGLEATREVEPGVKSS